jgi:hypothetical protein
MPLFRCFRATLVLGLVALAPPAGASAQAPPPDPDRVSIDMGHILKGRVNRQGDLVGIHHAPSAPKSMTVSGRPTQVHFLRTSPGGRTDVRTVRVQLLDPQTGNVVLEKSSTVYPDAWTPDEIENAIREAYADARGHRRIDSRGRWQGQTRGGVRIDGYMTYDGRGIATAFPVYVRRNERPNRR